MIEGMDIFPVIDLETGDYIGYKIKNRSFWRNLGNESVGRRDGTEFFSPYPYVL